VRPELSCASSLAIPAHNGADRLVPPMQQATTFSPVLVVVAQNDPGLNGLAISATSGMSRLPSLGTPGPV
jgi:hypothetical protein